MLSETWATAWRDLCPGHCNTATAWCDIASWALNRLIFKLIDTPWQCPDLSLLFINLNSFQYHLWYDHCPWIILFFYLNIVFITFKCHVFAPMWRFQLQLIYLYFPPSFHLIVGCFCPVGLQDRNNLLLDGRTVENKGKLILIVFSIHNLFVHFHSFILLHF
jgi:hypothetical protein